MYERNLADGVLMIDITDQFLDNARVIKKEITLVGHWTGGSTAAGAIQHLDTRRGGKGSVGYNVIINRNGVIFLLAEYPNYMHNTGLGDSFDKNVISYSLVMTGAKDQVSKAQVKALAVWIKTLEKQYVIKKHVSHASLNKKKIDFPPKMWDKLMNDINKYKEVA